MSGLTALAAASCAAAAAVLLVDAPVAERRLNSLELQHAVSQKLASMPRQQHRAWWRLSFLAGTAALTGFLFSGAKGAIAFAVIAAVASGLMHLIAATADQRDRQRSAAAVAPCADLLAACLHAGASPEEAVASVAATIGGPLQEPLSRVVVAMRAGADPGQAWALSASCPALVPIARSFVRASRSGAPLAATMSAVADEQRRIRRWQAEAAARRAGVIAVAPLVLCFLPAFILVGVVPVIVGVATQALANQ